jgi:hypothetical protein
VRREAGGGLRAEAALRPPRRFRSREFAAGGDSPAPFNRADLNKETKPR